MKRYSVLRYFSPEEPSAPASDSSISVGKWPYNVHYIHIADLLQVITCAVLPKNVVWGFSGTPENAAFVLGTHGDDSFFVKQRGRGLTHNIEARVLEYLMETIPGNNGHGPMYASHFAPPEKSLALVPLDLFAMKRGLRLHLTQRALFNPRDKHANLIASVLNSSCG